MAARCLQLAALLSFSFFSGALPFPLGPEAGKSPTCGYESCHATQPDMLNVHLVPHTHDDNPDRRFIYVETAFFYRWWRQQSSSMKQTVKQLVEEGRLEFVNGGWCMSDEATTHYSSVIDQMTLGLRFLNETFGLCGRPRSPGTSTPSDTPGNTPPCSLRWGMTASSSGDRSQRMATKDQELLWRASESLTPPMADLFTGILPNGYNPPTGFCWDQSCDDPPIRDDPELEDYNVDDVSMVYKTNHIIMTMGSDFQYENANLWYKNLDKLIRYVNAEQADGGKVNVLYSTPSCTEPTAPAGALKRYERISNSNLQTCNQLEVLGGPGSRKGPFGEGDSQTLSETLKRWRWLSITTRWSGTEKQHVANDYARRLANGWQRCQFSVNVYNPLARPVSYPVRLPVNGSSYEVTDANGKPVDCQVLPVSSSTQEVRRSRGSALRELLFQAEAPPLGFTTFTVSMLKDGPPPASTSPRTPTSIQNKVGLSNLETKQSIKLTQNFYWYNASDGNNAGSDQPSGAYIFRPNSSTPFIISSSAKTESIQVEQLIILHLMVINYNLRSLIRGLLCDCRSRGAGGAAGVFSWVSQVVRLYSDRRELELEWTVGPVPIHIKTSEYFYTDSNGREMLRRRKDFRPSWTLRQSEPIAGNYYPINSRAFIKLHRRLLYDDVRGVAEPLNETSHIFPEGLVVRGGVLLSLQPPPRAADAHRPLAQQWDEDSLLLRLEHQFQRGESKVNSEPVTVNLQKPLLKEFQERSVWEVTLRPMEIRTFLLGSDRLR
ncbi:hypothetical protein F7725_006215 [Dissostichus mawsoni]|uniref:Lysosomal alpha-mannosidase n=1 Tax=Dissostichus mawsoni TaxID=36200 RepID=A0A7J5YTS7_DISMA|nr:hypothetical protein F7725_006215 [Dissostichus mawsoni]